MKTHSYLAAAIMMAVLGSAASAQESAPASAMAEGVPAAAEASAASVTSDAPAPAATVPTVEPEASAPAAPGDAEGEAESAPPQKIDPALLRRDAEDSTLFVPPAGETTAPEADPSSTAEPDATFLSRTAPEGEQGEQGKERPLKKGSADQLRQAIRIRELKTQILNDVSNPITALILVEKAKAKGATTYEGRRVALRNYHTLLAKRIVALDGSLKQPVEADLYNKLRELEQRRVRPSVLIEPVAPVEGSNSAAYEPSR